MTRQALGRGLSALLGEDSTSPDDAETPREIGIDLISPNPEQPRTRFSETSLAELAQSIRANGVIQPIVVRKYNDGFQIVAGERRWRAAQLAELKRIPAVVREVSDEKLLELALIENIQRQELNPVEEARAYRKLIENIGLTQEQVAERVGKERSVITTSIRLLRLPNEIQRVIEEGSLSAGHGRALLTTDDPKTQRAIANAAIDNGWSVRETERAVKRVAAHGGLGASPAKSVTKSDPNVRAAETKLMHSLNTKVKILPGKKGSGGKIEIEYYTLDDLDRIFSVILSK